MSTIVMDLSIIFYIFYFCLGAIVGSFLNVVSLRLHTGKSIVYARSTCMHCAKQLTWYELIPIFSFLFQWGRCRNCKAKISSQYILVELAAGFLFASLAHIYLGIAGGSSDYYNFLFHAIIFSILIIIFVYDLRHMIIPDSLSYLFSFLALGKLILDFTMSGGLTFLFSSLAIWHLLAGPILAFPFFLIWLLSSGRLMGLGDSKLTLGIGWLLGISAGLTALIFAFWIGAVVSLILIALNHVHDQKDRLTLKSQVPFAPFLIIALVIVFFSQFDLINFIFLGL